MGFVPRFVLVTRSSRLTKKNVVNHQVLPARSKVLDYRLHGDRSVMATFMKNPTFDRFIVFKVDDAFVDYRSRKFDD